MLFTVLKNLQSKLFQCKESIISNTIYNRSCLAKAVLTEEIHIVVERIGFLSVFSTAGLVLKQNQKRNAAQRDTQTDSFGN